MGLCWSGTGLLAEYRTGYVDKLRAHPSSRWSILAGEMVPLLFQTAAMAGVVLVLGLLLGATIATGIGGFVLVLLLTGAFGIAFAGTSFVAALLAIAILGAVLQLATLWALHRLAR